jgi:Uncharacterized membrane protein
MDVWQISTSELCIRLFSAVLMGGIIGWERELSNQSAGFRTHILVCVGSALIMLLSMYGFADYAYEANVRMDPARLAAQVISGIGFLGAGTILRNGLSISGLTTAASLWVVAAIGLSVGAGFYLPSIIATSIVFTNLFILNRVEKRVFKSKKIQYLLIHGRRDMALMARLNRIYDDHQVTVRKMSIVDKPDNDQVQLHYSLTGKKKGWLDVILTQISQCEGVQSVTVQDRRDAHMT